MSNADTLPTLATKQRDVNAVKRPRLSAWHAMIQPNDEEWANGLSHAIGWLMSIAGAVLVCQQAVMTGMSWRMVGCLVFCAALIAVYAASTLSHWVRTPIWRRRWRCWDQGLIYVLIAATYTPLAAAYLDGWWHMLTLAMWTLAVAGFVSKVTFAHRINGISLWLYLALGWMPAVALPTLLVSAPVPVFVLVLGGGIAYTLGAALLLNDHRAPYLHVGWHLMVIVGSTLHFCTVWLYLVPVAA